MISHQDARKELILQFKSMAGREPNQAEVQLPQAVSWHETNYGSGWKGAGIGSLNMGALTAGKYWQGDTFVYGDSYPKSDGTNVHYETKFRKYPTAAAGFRDLLHFLYERNTTWGSCGKLVLPRATAGDLHGFTTGMFVTRYFAGFGKTPEERIAGYEHCLHDALVVIGHALNETMPDGSALPPPPPRTLRQGMTGDDVLQLQIMLKVSPLDGVFGPKTAAALKLWQSAHHLAVDAIFGSASRAVARREGFFA